MPKPFSMRGTLALRSRGRQDDTREVPVSLALASQEDLEMGTVRLTMAQALVRFLCAQMTEAEGGEAPLFGGVWAIFGHGNVAGLGEALHAA